MLQHTQTKLYLIGRPTFKCMDLCVGVQCRKYNESVIRDHLGNCLVNSVIVSGDVLKTELYNNIHEGYYFCN